MTTRLSSLGVSFLICLSVRVDVVVDDDVGVVISSEGFVVVVVSVCVETSIIGE